MYHYSSEVPYRDDIPEDLYLRVLDDAAAESKAEHDRYMKASRKLPRVRDQYFKELETLVGESVYERYRRLHERRVRKMRKARYGEPTTETTSLQSLRADNIAQSRKLIARAGVEMAKIHKLRDRYSTRIARGRLDPVPAEVQIMPPNLAAALQDAHIVSFRPPYTGAYRHFRATFNPNSSKIIESTSRHGNAVTGDLSIAETLRVTESQEFDTGHARGVIGFYQWFQAPESGFINVIAEFESPPLIVRRTNVSGRLEEDCGDVWAKTLQVLSPTCRMLFPKGTTRNSYTYSPTSGGGSAFDTYSYQYERGDQNWDEDRFHVGQKVRVFMEVGRWERRSGGDIFWPATVNQGDWVVLQIGLRTLQGFHSSDYQIHLEQNVALTLKEIASVITPINPGFP